MYIKNHRLQGEGITQLKCSKNKRKLRNHVAVVLHYTANARTQAAIRYLTLPGVPVSCHIVISREGEIFELLPLNVEAWHAGKSELDGLHNLNYYSIGIEMVNMGRLILMNNRYYNCYNQIVSADEVYIHEDKNTGFRSYWHRYTPAQIAAVKAVTERIIAHYKIKKVVAHSEIAPGRKQDPGLAFPLDQLKALVKK